LIEFLYEISSIDFEDDLLTEISKIALFSKDGKIFLTY
jgi:hypothetical protein